MNVHISDDIKKKWITHEFKGKPFILKDGKNYMRAYSKFFQKTHIYDFSRDFMWFSINDIPIDK